MLSSLAFVNERPGKAYSVSDGVQDDLRAISTSKHTFMRYDLGKRTRAHRFRVPGVLCCD